jgi:two-component system sensor histidine kinase AlgZ
MSQTRARPTRAAEAAKVRDLLPDFCRLPTALGVILYGELLAIVLALASPSPLADFWARLGPLSLLVLIAALFSALLLCLLRRPMQHCDGRFSLLLAWLLIVGVALAVTLGAGWLLPWGEQGGLFPDDGLRGLSIRAGLISAIVGALMLRYLYLHRQWRAQVEAVANARFETLQARIRPHFLFNSMNTIASLTQTNPRLAEEVVMDLADLFRASLSTEAGTTTLAEELELVRRYLNIEHQRLGERLRVHWDLQDLPGAARVPSLIVQPLVENAVYHGIEPTAEPGLVRIVGRYRRGMVNLSVRNTLPDPAAAGGAVRRGSHTALDNVSQRMAAMFAGTALVSRSRVDGDYLVRMAFPHPWRQP